MRHAQLGFRCSHTRGRCVKVGLLLGWIEPGQEIAGVDVGADVHKPLEHASAHPERQVGAEAGLDLAGQRYGSLSLSWLNKLGVHQRGMFDRSGGAVIAGAERNGQKRDSERCTHGPRNGQRGRIKNERVHSGLL